METGVGAEGRHALSASVGGDLRDPPKAIRECRRGSPRLARVNLLKNVRSRFLQRMSVRTGPVSEIPGLQLSLSPLALIPAVQPRVAFLAHLAEPAHVA